MINSERGEAVRQAALGFSPSERVPRLLDLIGDARIVLGREDADVPETWPSGV